MMVKWATLAVVLGGCPGDRGDSGRTDDTEPPCVDDDEDGVCNESDRCEGDDATGDRDEDGRCDDLDLCAGEDATGDSDGDGICDDSDRCEGDDASGDRDSDGVCDDVDNCVQLYDPEQDHLCNVVFVNPGATGDADGSTWLDGFTTVQAGIDAADAREEPHEVWLVGGTYRPANQGDPVAVLPAGLVLRGGYDATSSFRQDVRGRSVLSGDFAANDVPLDLDVVEAEREAPDQPSRSDNSATVVRMASETSLSGVEVRDGYTVQPQIGVGIEVLPASLGVMIRDVFVHHNIGAVRNAQGGGLGVGPRSEVEVRNSRFEANIAWNGAGLYLNATDRAVVDTIVFRGNEGLSQGAGAYIFNGRSQFDHCEFIGNRIVGNTGAAFRAEESTGSISDSLFDANEGEGSIQIDPDRTYRLDNVTVVDHRVPVGVTALMAGPDTDVFNSIFYGNDRDLPAEAALLPGRVDNTCAPSDLSRLGAGNIRLDGRTAETGSPFSSRDATRRLLAHEAAGDATTSACVDAGDIDVADRGGFPLWRFYTTRTDDILDGAAGDALDLGYHYLVE